MLVPGNHLPVGIMLRHLIGGHLAATHVHARRISHALHVLLS
jgi:hypothetical protein